MSALFVALVIGALLCGLQAIRAERLLLAALWLAGLSALVSLLLYLLGAAEVAVIELSVGAGLVTVLFVFAISIAGEDAMDARALVPGPWACALVVLCVILLGALSLPVSQSPVRPEPSFAVVLWQTRGLDVLAQVVLIFAGALGVRGLLAETDVRVAIADFRLRLAQKPEVSKLQSEVIEEDVSL
jgi:uncharacterized MnhB-related membrane protein